MTQLFSGKEVSASVYESLTPRIQALKSKGITPGLAVILVGDDPASAVYVRSKTRKFASLDLFSETIRFDSDISQEDLILKLQDLNVDNRFHGILVQFPLPKHIDEGSIISHIDPVKDVDGFHPENVGYLTGGNPRFIPCTPKGIMRILSFYGVELSGKHVVIIGRSNIVGRPVSILTSLKKSFSNATTTICHSGTQDIRYFTNQADVVVTAMGVPNFLDESFIKPGAVLIDVGINRVNDDSEKGYKLVGDIHAESVSEIAGALTPVPGGVGPMTIAMLVENTVEAAEMQSGVGA